MMGLPEFAQISEENELLRDQIRDLETENADLKAEIHDLEAAGGDLRDQINELKVRLNAKEEFATTHRELAQFDGAVWSRDVTVMAPEWERVREV